MTWVQLDTNVNCLDFGVKRSIVKVTVRCRVKSNKHFGGIFSLTSGMHEYILMIRNSSGDEIANVNFLYDDIVHVLQ